MMSTSADETTVIPQTPAGPASPVAPGPPAARPVTPRPLAPRPLAQIEARDITAWFGQRKVLDRVSLTMPAGQITALIGPSGCGKSTFLRILNRMHELVPSAQLGGEVLLDGQDIYDPEKKLIDARRAIKPRVLLMDEPCSALDPTSTRVIEETMKELAHEVTIVIVTHNMQQAARVSDTCAFFLASQGTPGVIVEHGDTAAMFQSPQDQRTSDYVHGRFG
jgi:ABC-type phosphate transport system ATPase subunit